MNQENDRAHDSEVDSIVSHRFKAASGETAPDDLNVAVMREARRALRADNRKGSFGAWFRPLAFLATVGLSLAIILDLTDTTSLAPEPAAHIESLPSATLNELKRQEKSSATDPQAGNAFATESRKAVERLHSLESTTEASSEALPAECSEVEQSAADTWWQCIESLRAAGRLDAANRQLENLRNAFPEFEPPR